MSKILKLLLSLLLLVSCVGTIEESEQTINSKEKVPTQNFSFLGVEDALWVSNTRLSARFKPASGGSGQFYYEMQSETGDILASSKGDSEPQEDSEGFISLTAKGLISGASYRVLIRAYDSDQKIADTNEKYVSVQLPSDNYPSYEGVQSCSIFPGSGGQNQIVLNWQIGVIETSAFGFTPESVGLYTIYYCRASSGTNCLYTDSPDRGRVTVVNPRSVEGLVSGLDPGTDYIFRMSATSIGRSSLSISPLEERNRKVVSCKTISSTNGAIVFDGVESVTIKPGEDGVSQAVVNWEKAEGGFEGYNVYFHPISDENGVFNPADPNLMVLTGLGVLDITADIAGMFPFTWHAISVKACQDYINDPGCVNGNDGNGKFVVVETKPRVAEFQGFTSYTNNPVDPREIFVSYVAPNFSTGGIADELRVFVIRDGVRYDISSSSVTNTLGVLYPTAPSDIHSLYLVGFNNTDFLATSTTVAGLAPGQFYSIDIRAYVDRTVSLPSGGTLVVEYTDEGTVPITVSNNDTTPPSIVSVVSSVVGGYLTTGNTINFQVTFTESLAVFGAPRIALDIGGVIRFADYVSGNGLSVMSFTYTVGAGDNDNDGIEFSSENISLNAGVIQDVSGNNALLSFAGLAPNINGIFIDTILPSPPASIVLDNNWVTSLESPVVSWTNPSSDFSFAQVGIGTAPGVVNVQSYVTANNTNSHQFTSLPGLVECVVDYYAIARSVDPAGLISSVETSVGTFKYDGTPPVAPSGLGLSTLESPTTTEAPVLSWTVGSDSCDFDRYEIAIGFDSAGDGFGSGDIDNFVPWTTLPGDDSLSSYHPVNGIDGFSINLIPTILYRTSIRAIDAAGNISGVVTSAQWQFDTSIPVVTIDVSPGINASNNMSYSLSGTCTEDGREVTVDVGGVIPLVQPTCSGGAWGIMGLDVSSIVDNPVVTITADHSDAAANNAPQASVNVAKDSVVPVVTITSSPNITVLNVNNYAINGTCSEEGDVVTVDIGVVAPAVQPICTGGVWAITGLDVNAVPDSAAVAVTAEQVDLAGNIGLASTTIDKSTSLAITSAPDIDLSNVNDYVVEGTCSVNGAVVNIAVGSVIQSTTCSGGFFNSGLFSVAAVPDGAVGISIAHAGLPLVSTTVTKDTLSDTVTFTSTPNITVSNQTSYSISGSCSINATAVNVVIDTLPFSATCSSGAWAIFNVDVSSLADGSGLVITADHAAAPQATASVNKATNVPTVSNLIASSVLVNTLDLTWNLNDPGGFVINDYIIEYRIKGAPTWTVFSDGVSTNAYSPISGLLEQTTYEFRVNVQYDTVNNSDWSNIAEATTKINSPIFGQNAAMNVGGATASQVAAYYDNTNVTLNGAPLVTLNRGQTFGFTSAQFDVIDADQPIYTAGVALGTANIVWQPTSWAGKSFAFNAVRANPQSLFIYAIENTVVEVREGGVLLGTTTITAGNGGTISWSNFGSYQVSSTGDILAYHMSNGGWDPKPLLPGAAEIIGFPSSSMRLTTSTNSTNYSLIHSNSVTATGSLNTGDAINIGPQGTSSLYQSESLLLSADRNITGASFADSNGVCAAPFLPTSFMKRNYVINVGSSYVAFASKQPGTISVFDSSDILVASLPLTRSGADPNAPYRARMGTALAGYRYFSTVPVAGWYHPNTNTNAANQDETVLYGTNE